MKKTSILFLLAAICQLWAACEKTALTTASDSVSRPIVEAYLAPGALPKVKITYQLALGSSGTTLQVVDNLSVTITSDGTSHPLTYSPTDTAYVADGSWPVLAGQVYRISFAFGDDTVTGETTVPHKPENFSASAGSIEIQPIGSPGSGGGIPSFPDPIKLSWDNTDGAYYLVVVENLESDPEAIFEDSGNGDSPTRPTFRSEPEQSTSYEVGFQNFEYYGTHRVVLFRLNADYASLYDNNGNSSQNLTAPYSNITGGLGIFTGLNSDTLMVEVTK